MTHKILIVEEDEILSGLFVEYLSTKGFTIITAKTKSEAISNFNSDIDICIFDLTIKNINAFELINKFNEIISGMPFVYLFSGDFPNKINISDVDEKIKLPYNLEDINNAINNIYSK